MRDVTFDKQSHFDGNLDSLRDDLREVDYTNIDEHLALPGDGRIQGVLVLQRQPALANLVFLRLGVDHMIFSLT